MSIRLNRDHRMLIIDKLIGDRFDKLREELQTDFLDLGLQIYETAFSEEEREMMDSLPEDWLPTDCYIRAELGGQYHSFRLPDKVSSVRVPYGRCHGALLKVGARHELCKRFRTLQDRQKKIKEDEEELRVDIDTNLRAATTAKKLVEIWPEIADVVEEVVKAPVSRELAPLDLSKLNAELGLSKSA